MTEDKRTELEDLLSTVLREWLPWLEEEAARKGTSVRYETGLLAQRHAPAPNRRGRLWQVRAVLYEHSGHGPVDGYDVVREYPGGGQWSRPVSSLTGVAALLQHERLSPVHVAQLAYRLSGAQRRCFGGRSVTCNVDRGRLRLTVTFRRLPENEAQP